MPRCRVLKYPLDFGSKTVVMTQPTAKFLKVVKQGEAGLVAYFQTEVTETVTLTEDVHVFVVATTGQEFELNEEMEYMDTFLFEKGSFVCHAYKQYPITQTHREARG